MAKTAKRSVRTDYKRHAARKEQENQALRVALSSILLNLGRHYGGGLLTARPPASDQGSPVAEAYRVAEEASRLPVASV